MRVGSKRMYLDIQSLQNYIGREVNGGQQGHSSVVVADCRRCWSPEHRVPSLCSHIDFVWTPAISPFASRCCRKSCREQQLPSLMRSDLLRNPLSSCTPQVFIHDPLYKWAMTPQDAQQRQQGDQDTRMLDGPSERDARPLNADAERALLRVKQKLKGLEGGVSSCFPACCLSASRGPVQLNLFGNSVHCSTHQTMWACCRGITDLLRAGPVFHIVASGQLRDKSPTRARRPRQNAQGTPHTSVHLCLRRSQRNTNIRMHEQTGPVHPDAFLNPVSS